MSSSAPPDTDIARRPAPPTAPLNRPDPAAPLKDVQILAVEQYGAAPFGTQHLADLGARVIKIENRHSGGDYARALGPYFVAGAKGSDTGLFFQSVNRNKSSLALDLKTEAGQEVLARLAAGSDAIANNLRGDVPDKLGLSYASMQRHNPRIVCAHCSAYGRRGPRRGWPGYDFLMQAEAGYFHLSGEPDTPPTRMGLSLVDFMAGSYMALGLLAGVVAARSSGWGRDVDVSLRETALFSLSYLGVWALNSDYQPTRVARSAHATMVPCQLYRTASGWMYLMCNKEKFWRVLCALIERKDLAEHEDYATFAARLRHRDRLTEILDEVLMRRSTMAWLECFAGRVPAAAVLSPREALDAAIAEDPRRQVQVHLRDGRDFATLRSPILATDAPPPARACPPLGADTEAILQEYGYSPADIAALRAQKVI